MFKNFNPPLLLFLLCLLRVSVEEQIGHDLPLKMFSTSIIPKKTVVGSIFKRSVIILASNVDQTAFPIFGSSSVNC